jgi:hypothetical protein
MVSIDEYTPTPNPGNLFRRGWMRPPSNEVNEKLIYFFCLSVNYNNRSPAVGNDSQNGIHCRQQATKIYELTNNIVMNNNIARMFV